MHTCRNLISSTMWVSGIELGLSGLAESPFTPLPISRALKKNLLIIYDEPTTYHLEWIDPQIGKLRRSLDPRKTEHLAVKHTLFSNSSLKDFSGKGTPCTKVWRVKDMASFLATHGAGRTALPVIKGGGSFVTRFYMGMGAFRLRAKLSTPQSTTKPFLHISQHGFPSFTVLI